MSGCPDENQLGLLAEGRLDEPTLRNVERHLDGCPACTRLVGELARLAPPMHPVPERYTVLRQLGAGGMGVVWEAEDRQLQRRVALKWVAIDPSGDDASTRERRARLYREARALARLRHPNVLAVHDVGEIGDEVFLAMEMIEGVTARAWREATPRTSVEILAIWRQVGAGLGAVHRAGIVHRDVKPDNVMVASDGRVVLADFGLATDRHAEPVTALTGTGQVLGTPLYMAPEQLRGEPATARSDQFAFCVCVWEALAGARPFPGTTAGALAVAILEPPTPPPDVDRPLFAVLARGLAADPLARWHDLDELLAAIEAPPRSLRRRSVIAIGAVAMVAAVGGGVWWVARATEDPRGDALQTAAIVDARPALDAAAAAHDTIAEGPQHDVSDAGPGRRNVAVADPRRTWAIHYNEALTRASHGDGGGCLAELARIGTLPADLSEAQVDDLVDLRARCTMRAGDCSGGRAALETHFRRRGWSADKIAHVVDGADALMCALAEPPEARWPARAELQLAFALSHKDASCRPVFAFIDAHHVALPKYGDQLAALRITCLVYSNDCAGARAAWRATYAAVWTGDELERRFDTMYPTCAP